MAWQIKAGTALATWDPLTRPIITEYAGTVKFENVEEGVDGCQADRRSDRSVDAGRDRCETSRFACTKTLRPQVKLLERRKAKKSRSPDTEHSVTIGFQVGALITVKDGQQVHGR